jgi:hypothetical protein
VLVWRQPFRDWRYNNDDCQIGFVFTTTQPMVEKSLLEETLALALQENMQLGLFMITVSDVGV